MGKAFYRFFARFADELVAYFSVFKVKTLNISFVSDDNMIVFHIALGHCQLIVGNFSQEIVVYSLSISSFNR